MTLVGGVDITFRVEVAFGYAPGDPAPVWTDVTDYFAQFSTARGRQYETDDDQAGTATVVLENWDRRFDPSYTGGPYGANVTPTVPVRIRVTRGATTWSVFRGYADRWTPRLDADEPGTAIVELPATDGFKALALSYAPESVWASTVTASAPTGWWRLGETVGTTMSDSSGNGHHGLYGGGATFHSRGGLIAGSGDTAIDFTAVVEGTVSGALITSTAFTVEGWFNVVPGDANAFLLHGPNNNGLGTPSPPWAMVAIVPATNGAVGFYLAEDDANYTLRQTTVAGYDDGHTHHVMVTRTASTVVIYVDGAVVAHANLTIGSIATTAALSGPVKIGYTGYGPSIDGTLDEWAIYDGVVLSAADALEHYQAGAAPWDGDLSGARIGELLDVAGWPAGLRSLDTGLTLSGPANLGGRPTLDLIREVVTAEAGRLFVAGDGTLVFHDRMAPVIDATATTSQATFGSNATDVNIDAVDFDDAEELIRNACTVTLPSGATFSAEDATSIAAHWRRHEPISAPDMTGNVAQALADWTVFTRKDRQFRIASVTIDTTADSDNFDQVLDLELGHRITVNVDMPGTGSYSADVIVEGIAHAVSTHRWVSTLWCSPAPTYSLIIVGVSLVGDGSICGF